MLKTRSPSKATWRIGGYAPSRAILNGDFHALGEPVNPALFECASQACDAVALVGLNGALAGHTGFGRIKDGNSISGLEALTGSIGMVKI